MAFKYNRKVIKSIESGMFQTTFDRVLTANVK